eukprot:GDKK01020082.1.p1 GENE.GDKK01020082.1~~GDKK01020082.1.p1  ORF type:complete len:111 (-),score=19.43 GDKK01020082.1:33-338(-)
MSDVKNALHNVVDFNVKTVCDNLKMIVEHSKINPSNSAYDDARLSTFHVRVSVANIQHACRTLLQVASELSLSDKMYDVATRLKEVQSEEENLEKCWKESK